MYTPIEYCRLCPKGKHLYKAIEKTDKKYHQITQVGITDEQFKLLSKGIATHNKKEYETHIPIGKIKIFKLKY